ncbi:MAG TPA: CoA-binding protein [Desulfotomaculum sp.]|nr:CoA-binding protein [Desulfotomaculum sp.]
MFSFLEVKTLLDFFFEPQGVVFVGISTRPGREEFNFLQNIKAEGYQGKAYGVNPQGGMLGGERLYRSVRELPEPVELAVIMIPREAVIDTFKECIAAGVKGVIIITQGFADADAVGKAMQEEIVHLAKESGARVIGPNSMGLTNAFNRFSTLFNYWDIPERPVSVGVASQTGFFTCSMPFTSGGVGLSMDLGNTADVSFAEVISYYDRNSRIKVITLHIEDIKEGREFIRVAGEASRRKPILAIKGGVSETGKKAAASHCGSLAGEGEVYQAAFKRAGVIQVKDTEDLHDLCKAFLYYPPLQNNRIAIVSPTGGAAIMATDACEAHGLKVASLAPETLDYLRRFSPEWFEPPNPIDLWIAGMAQGYEKTLQEALEALMVDHNVDAVIDITPAIDAPTRDNSYGRTFLDVIIPIARKKIKPLVVWPFGTHTLEYINILDKNEILGFTGGEQAARVIAGLYRYGIIQNRPQPGSPPAVVSRERARAILKQPHHQAIINVLEEYGVPVVVTYFAPELDTALGMAGAVGYPVALKIFSPAISHKSDVGGVKLNIQNPEELRVAYKDLIAAVKSKIPGIAVEGVIIQPYLPGGVEVLLGVKQDPQFGPVVVYGSGGILAEIVADVSFELAPVDDATAWQMITRTRSYALLKGVRGSPAVDIDSLIQAIVSIGQLAVDFPEIKELDLNPLMVYRQGVMALDVRMVIK